MIMKKNLLLLLAVAVQSAFVFAQTRVVAHRGYWTCAGSAQNSIASLKASDRIGVYGSEFDVHLTKDDSVVVFHDDVAGKMPVQTTNYKALMKHNLKNGERIPTLAQYLDAAKPLTTRLVLEVKEQYSKSHEDSLVQQVVDLVARKGLEDRTEYISFSKNACLKLKELRPEAKIAYLGGDWDPQTIKAKGLTGIDYENTVFAAHPEWIQQCHDLGLTVNVWTVDDLNDIDQFVKAGVDFITTNKPVEAMKLAR